MIELFSGTPGSGKSLHMAKNILQLLNQKKECLVICNFPILLDKVKYPERFILLDNTFLSTSEGVNELRAWAILFFEEHKRKENSLHLFIDEAQLLFNSRDWNTKGRKEWISFFTQHRKYCYHVYLVAQFDQMIDKQIRSLIEYEQIHRKITNNGFIGGLVYCLTFGDVFICVSHWYGINKKTDQYIFKARKKYYEIYDTFADFTAAW